jgi:hippurate hydrolase
VFHSKPELSFQEQITAARLANAWQQCGFEVTTGVGGYGIVGLPRAVWIGLKAKR